MEERRGWVDGTCLLDQKSKDRSRRSRTIQFFLFFSFLFFFSSPVSIPVQKNQHVEKRNTRVPGRFRNGPSNCVYAVV